MSTPPDRDCLTLKRPVFQVHLNAQWRRIVLSRRTARPSFDPFRVEVIRQLRHEQSANAVPIQ